VCYSAKFCRSALKCRHKYRSTLKIAERLNSAHLGWEVWLTPRYTSLPDMRYHVKFGSSATKGVPINRKEPLKLGSPGTTPPWGEDVAEPLKKQAPSHYVLPHQIW